MNHPWRCHTKTNVSAQMADHVYQIAAMIVLVPMDLMENFVNTKCQQLSV